LEIPEYCRQIEAYLCEKNDGHLIRVVGPSFEIVSGWAAQGIPIKVACRGIDRYFERYYAKGPRRRPVKIDFCDADVLDVFDEWKKALGLAGAGPERLEGSPVDSHQSPGQAISRQSLPQHLERVLLKLSSARAKGKLGEGFDALIDRVAAELDAARSTSGGLRGDARQSLLSRLERIDAELIGAARASLAEDALHGIERDAGEELAGYRATMAPEAFARARDAVVDRLIRERFALPTVRFASS
jgi:hypothetical protein